MLLALAAFSATAALIILFPGPDTLVVLRAVVRRGRAHGWTTAAGVCTGLTVWIVMAVLGLTAVLRASEVAYSVLRIAGACYLGWLGVQSLRSLRRRQLPELPGRGGIVGTGFGAGLVTDLLNPKVGVFFVTFLPGFVPRGYPIGTTSLLFGGVYLALTAAYLLVLLVFANRLTAWLRTPRIRRRLDVLTGGVLVAFGVRLATES